MGRIGSMFWAGYPKAWWGFISSPARWTESVLNSVLTWAVVLVPSVGGGLIGSWKLGTWQGVAIGALWFCAYLMVAGTRMQHERDTGPRIVFGEPFIKEDEGTAGLFYAVLPVSNQPRWPKPSADVPHSRAEVAFFPTDQDRYAGFEVPPFEARWSSNPPVHPHGPLPLQETTLWSNGHSDAVDIAVMQKHSAAHWWNNESARNLFRTERLLPLDNYQVRVRIVGHDAKGEQWLRFQREKGKPLPSISKLNEPPNRRYATSSVSLFSGSVSL